MIDFRRVFDEMARKWRSKAASRRLRRQICLPRNAASGDYQRKNAVAQKGHFVVYSIDKKRFEVPLRYLNHDIFIELLKLSQEEFGLPASGPITLPCEAVFMELAMSSLLQQKSFQKCSMSSFDRQEESSQRMLLGPAFKSQNICTI